MVIQFILLIVLSTIVVIWPNSFAYLLHWLNQLYRHLSHGLGLIFSHSALGQLIQSTLALLIIPIGVGIICAVILKLMQKKQYAVVTQMVWFVWVLLVATIVLT